MTAAANRSPMAMVWRAASSAAFLSPAPSERAMALVAPVPRPKTMPMARKTTGMLKVRAARASPPSMPTKNMSVRL